LTKSFVKTSAVVCYNGTEELLEEMALSAGAMKV
jgi:hypothetical protein